MTNAILDERDAWSEAYESGWLAHLRATGEMDWKRYPRPRNAPLARSSGIDPQQAKLLLVSSAGGYNPTTQEPFDAANPFGDYTIRELPFFDHDPATLGFAHDHYDGTARDEDVGVLLPHRLLEERHASGLLRDIAPTFVSFSGYQPDLRRVVDELCPRAVEVALREHATAALLVPS